MILCNKNSSIIVLLLFNNALTVTKQPHSLREIHNELQREHTYNIY